jgi:hypothetical protein
LNQKDHKEKMLTHLAAEQLDSVNDKEEVVLDCGCRADLLVDEWYSSKTRLSM